jgi:hypothetical protein
MKSLTLFFALFVGFKAHADGSTLADCLKERGTPVAVVTGFRKEKQELRTISLYGLDRGALGRIANPEERVLVYTSDLRFAEEVEAHFKDMVDPGAHVGWSMFATLMWGTALDLVRFDAKGRLIDETHVVIDVAILEEGTEGHLVRVGLKRKEPNQSSDPTPRSVTPPAGQESRHP